VRSLASPELALVAVPGGPVAGPPHWAACGLSGAPPTTSPWPGGRLSCHNGGDGPPGKPLLEQGVSAVAGVGFGRPGFLRLSITTPMDTIERSLPAFERALRAVRGGHA
jgi:hypothetical protein